MVSDCVATAPDRLIKSLPEYQWTFQASDSLSSAFSILNRKDGTYVIWGSYDYLESGDYSERFWHFEALGDDGEYM